MVFSLKCSIFFALTGLLILVSCLANLIFLDLITIGLILLGDIYKSWRCAVCPFLPHSSGRTIYPFGLFRSQSHWLRRHVLDHVPHACAGTGAFSDVYSSICIGDPTINTNWTVIPWRWSLWNLFRNIINNLPFNMTPYCSTDLSIRPHRCQNIKFHLNIFKIYSNFIFVQLLPEYICYSPSWILEFLNDSLTS